MKLKKLTAVFDLLKVVFLFFGIINFQSIVFAKSRLDDLFLWKVSDQLKLTVKDEQQLDRLLNDLREKRVLIQNTIENAVSNLEKSVDEKSQKKWLAEYKKAIQKLGELNLEELSRVNKLLGTSGTSKYFVIKASFSEKIKSALAKPGVTSDGQSDGPFSSVNVGNEPKVFPEPKVIEE